MDEIEKQVFAFIVKRGKVYRYPNILKIAAQCKLTIVGAVEITDRLIKKGLIVAQLRWSAGKARHVFMIVHKFIE